MSESATLWDDEPSGVEEHWAVLALFGYGMAVIVGVWGTVPSFVRWTVVLLAGMDLLWNQWNWNLQVVVAADDQSADCPQLIQPQEPVQAPNPPTTENTSLECVRKRSLDKRRSARQNLNLHQTSPSPTLNLNLNLNPRQVIDAVESIKLLVLLDPANTNFLGESQLSTLRGSILLFSDIAFAQSDSVRGPEKLCIEALPRLVANVQIICAAARHKIPNFGGKFGVERTQAVVDHVVATVGAISTLVDTAIDLPSVSYAFDDTKLQQSVVRALMDAITGDVALLEQSIASLIALVEVAKRDSLDTLTGSDNDDSDVNGWMEEDEEDARDLNKSSAYLVYVDDMNAFVPAAGGSRVGIAQMPSLGISSGDIFVILSGWTEAEGVPAVATARPRSNFIPAPPTLRAGVRSCASQKLTQQAMEGCGFKHVCVARVDAVEDLSVGSCRVAVSFLRERLCVPFAFSAVCGTEVARLILENRVRDAMMYGSVRVGVDVVDSFHARYFDEHKD
ncbi:hypothetical protein BC830DRAFT_1155679 [Chytriomyces sp. MP71]|nr:hypothetical protein BC830DRAFT_1155679 [Chytriomyces sp. MP71]